MYPLVFGSYNAYLLTLVAIAPIPVLMLINGLRREGVALRSVIASMLLLLAAAIVGAKLFSLASRGWPATGWSTAELGGGMRFSGVIIGVLLVLPLVRRWFLQDISLARAADVLAKTLVVAVCAGRTACIMAGCCTGAIGQGALYFAYPPGSKVWYQHLHDGVISNSQQWSEPVLALHGVFFLASLIAAVIVLRFDSKRRYDGQVFLLFLLVHELPKAALELLRVPLVPEQLATALIAGLLGLLGLIWFRRRSPPRSEMASRALPDTDQSSAKPIT